MNVTFMIGNGFDLACGLKTRYCHVYEEYCVTASKNDNIDKFKKELLAGKYDKWSDFEMALPEFAKELGDFDKFKECVINFTEFLNKYLKEQERLIDVTSKDRLQKVMTAYVYDFNKYCLQLSAQRIESYLTKPNESTLINFITFNYTDTLEKCLSVVSSRKKSQYYQWLCKPPIHIHDRLDKGILLGLDDEKWYADIPCNDKRKVKNFLDKLHINSQHSNIINRVEKTIIESNIIVFFGWSMGDSDSHWVNLLKKQFQSNNALHIVYSPYYTEMLNLNLKSQRIDREDDWKDYIAVKFDVSENDRGRLHIITTDDYMKLDFLSKSNKKLETDDTLLVTA